MRRGQRGKLGSFLMVFKPETFNFRSSCLHRQLISTMGLVGKKLESCLHGVFVEGHCRHESVTFFSPATVLWFTVSALGRFLPKIAHFLTSYLFVSFCVRVCACVDVCAHTSVGSSLRKPEEGAGLPCNWHYGELRTTMWVLRIKLESSARAGIALNGWASSPAPPITASGHSASQTTVVPICHL